MIGRFLKSRGTRKFLRSKIAVASLVIILCYLLAAAAIWTTGAVTLADTKKRVGAKQLPGFFQDAPADLRREHAEFYANAVERYLKRDSSNPADGLDIGVLRVAEEPREVLQARIDEIFILRDETLILELEEGPDAPGLAPAFIQLDKLVAQLFAPRTPAESRKESLYLLLGTDAQGRSILLRSLYSIRVAIQIGFVTALISVIFGSLLGAAAAFYGSWVDMIVIWLYSTGSSVPNLVLLAVLAFMFTGTALEQTLIPVYAAFCLTFWIGPCRVVRGEVLKLKELEYVQAATAIGFGKFYILLKHVIPNTTHLLFINFSLLFIGAIKSEVILSFLGLGVKDGPSWGIMISQSSAEVTNGFYWQIGAATAFMFGLVLAFNILTDALQDAFDPKHV